MPVPDSYHAAVLRAIIAESTRACSPIDKLYLDRRIQNGYTAGTHPWAVALEIVEATGGPTYSFKPWEKAS